MVQRRNRLVAPESRWNGSRRRFLGSIGVAAAGLGMVGRGAYAMIDRGPEPAARAAHARQPLSTPVSGVTQVRRNAHNLGPEERRALVNAILALKEKPSPWIPGLNTYDTFVLWHRDAMGCAVMAAHMGPAFLPWHRQFLRMFEFELQAIDPSVTIPYWDWTVDNAPDAPIWDGDFMGGNGDPVATYAVLTGPFRMGEWQLNVFDYDDKLRLPFITRNFGASPRAPYLPTAEDIETILSIPIYDTPPWDSTVPQEAGFRNALEGWLDCDSGICKPGDGFKPVCTGPSGAHNRVHRWVAGQSLLAIEDDAIESGTLLLGTMVFNTSPNDPVFWLHHANVDRLWSEWMRRHGPVYLPETGGPHGHNLDDPMWPFSHFGTTITPRMMLSSRDLGYVYEGEE